MTTATSNGIIKEVMPKRKRFTVLSVQFTYAVDDPDGEHTTADKLTVASSFVHVLAMDADKAAGLVTESLEQGSTVVAVMPGYTEPVYIRS